MFLIAVLCVLPESSTAETTTQSFTALRFNFDSSSYISFYPDMSPMTQSFTICLWIKKLRPGNGAPFTYRYGEIFMTDTGYHNQLFESDSLNGQLTNKFSTPYGSWYFYCSTWSLASRTFRVYHNGELIGTETTPSGRTLQTGGRLTLGNYLPNFFWHRFGGEMFNLNMFSRELTASEVASLSENGLCTPIPESLEDYRRIKWEEILKLSRSGTVQDFHTGCELPQELSPNKTLEEELNNTRMELKKTKIELEETKEDLMNVWDTINSKNYDYILQINVY